MDLELATEVFVRAFSLGKSFAHPYEVERVGRVWLMRDGPGRKEPRTQEWVGCQVPPAEILAAVRSFPPARHAICVIRAEDELDRQIRADFRGAGYRLLATEGFFVHDLVEMPEEGPTDVRRVSDQELADRLAKAARRRQILPEHIGREDAPVRQYVALDGDEIVGWVKSVSVCGATWCSNLYVQPSHRRKGVGGDLIGRMLEDDRAHGSRASVLLASHAGAMLYPGIGYRRIGELYVYVPAKRPMTGRTSGA